MALGTQETPSKSLLSFGLKFKNKNEAFIIIFFFARRITLGLTFTLIKKQETQIFILLIISMTKLTFIL